MTGFEKKIGKRSTVLENAGKLEKNYGKTPGRVQKVQEKCCVEILMSVKILYPC